MLNQFIFSILVITVIYNLQKIILESKNLVLSKSNIIERFDTCLPGQGPDSTSGYQCTLGCGRTSGGYYPWGSRDDAAHACRKRGFAGLCDKNTVEEAAALGDMNQCCLGWTNSLGNDSRGWYQTDKKWGCGGPRRWHPWMRSHAGAHCCGTSESYNALRKTAKSMNIMQTKLSNAEDELHRLSAGELDYNTARQRQEADMQKCKQSINEAEIQRQKDHADYLDSTVGAKRRADMDQEIAVTIAKRQAKLEKDAALKTAAREAQKQYDSANEHSQIIIAAHEAVAVAMDNQLAAETAEKDAAVNLVKAGSGAVMLNNFQAGDAWTGDEDRSRQAAALVGAESRHGQSSYEASEAADAARQAALKACEELPGKDCSAFKLFQP
jgi:hypothetical protein